MRRLTIACLSAALLAFGVSAFPVTASASVARQAAPAASAYGPNSYCWAPPHGNPADSCIWTNQVPGNALQNKPYYKGGTAQTWFYEYPQECGIVSTTCTPFTNGSGLNTMFAGYYLVTVSNQSSGYCVDDQDLDDPFLGLCSGNNGEVIAFSPSGVFSSAMVFVAASNSWFAEHGIVNDPAIVDGNSGNPNSGDLQLSFGCCSAPQDVWALLVG